MLLQPYFFCPDLRRLASVQCCPQRRLCNAVPREGAEITMSLTCQAPWELQFALSNDIMSGKKFPGGEYGYYSITACPDCIRDVRQDDPKGSAGTNLQGTGLGSGDSGCFIELENEQTRS